MNNINFILIGKIKDRNLQSLINDFILKLSKYCNCKLIYSEEKLVFDENNEKYIQQALEYEKNKVLKYIKQDDFLILLDLRGEIYSSEEFARKFHDTIQYHTNIIFLIGSSYGLSDDLRKRANIRLKLSNMTFTHPLSLLLILEQVFRSFKIINNEKYHK